MTPYCTTKRWVRMLRSIGERISKCEAFSTQYRLMKPIIKYTPSNDISTAIAILTIEAYSVILLLKKAWN